MATVDRRGSRLGIRAKLDYSCEVALRPWDAREHETAGLIKGYMGRYGDCHASAEVDGDTDMFSTA